MYRTRVDLKVSCCRRVVTLIPCESLKQNDLHDRNVSVSNVVSGDLNQFFSCFTPGVLRKYWIGTHKLGQDHFIPSFLSHH